DQPGARENDQPFALGQTPLAPELGIGPFRARIGAVEAERPANYVAIADFEREPGRTWHECFLQQQDVGWLASGEFSRPGLRDALHGLARPRSPRPRQAGDIIRQHAQFDAVLSRLRVDLRRYVTLRR